jgi:hypothetical protein
MLDCPEMLMVVQINPPGPPFVRLFSTVRKQVEGVGVGEKAPQAPADSHSKTNGGRRFSIARTCSKSGQRLAQVLAHQRLYQIRPETA